MTPRTAASLNWLAQMEHDHEPSDAIEGYRTVFAAIEAEAAQEGYRLASIQYEDNTAAPLRDALRGLVEAIDVYLHSGKSLAASGLGDALNAARRALDEVEG
jgi:hypothetical protein